MLLFFVNLQLLCHSSGQHIDQKYDHKKYKRNAKCYIILAFAIDRYSWIVSVPPDSMIFFR